MRPYARREIWKSQQFAMYVSILRSFFFIHWKIQITPTLKYVHKSLEYFSVCKTKNEWLQRILFSFAHKEQNRKVCTYELWWRWKNKSVRYETVFLFLCRFRICDGSCSSCVYVQTQFLARYDGGTKVASGKGTVKTFKWSQEMFYLTYTQSHPRSLRTHSTSFFVRLSICIHSPKHACK